MAKKRKKSKLKKVKKWFKKNKILAISIIIVGILLIAFGAKILLYINFLLGNDIVIKLNVDKADLSVVHGEKKNITFEASVTTNPFCKASCEYTFSDISDGNTVDYNEFTLKPGKPLIKSYTIEVKQLGIGQKLYRFDMECKSISSALCHTDEQPTTRSILVTVEYSLNEEEKIIKEDSRLQLEKLKQQLSQAKSRQLNSGGIIEQLSKNLILTDLEERVISLEGNIDIQINALEYLKEIWEKQDYYELKEKVEVTNNEITNIQKIITRLDIDLFNLVSRYNSIIEQLNEEKKKNEELRKTFITNSTLLLEINSTIEEFNSNIDKFSERDTISEKESILSFLTNKTENTAKLVKEQIRKESLKRQIELNVEYDALCEINGECIKHPSIKEYANQTEFKLKETCSSLEDLKRIYIQLNDSIQNDSINQQYPNSDEFWENITLKVKNIKQNIVNNYLSKMPENEINTKIIKELIVQKPLVESGIYPQYNLTPALTIELVKQQPESCVNLNFTFTDLKEFDTSKIETKESVPVNLGVVFEESLPKCCVFDKCDVCCISEECKNDPSKFPVVLLHGHAINKEVSAEYSLEGFNKIQKKLEEDGYLSAGTITLYTTKDTPPGSLGLAGVPLTIRTSYYFDIFKQPENYVVIQTKSENIDTYSVRLKELIDTIKYKTGKPKVNLVAYSMGGLVARRYIQIFGTSDVNKLILIGVPNKGIVGEIADYCPIIGEKRECKDMNADSLFINKLNRDPLPNIPVYNIVGTGCKMKNEVGDGIVLEKKSILEGANNFIINGTCHSKVMPLHLDLRDIDMYPEVYENIIKALKE